ncbi:outer membrane protein assembly factor BamE domain-containing protein [Bordetella genomosp. 4]|uniref:Outer membrane protein assembly factor BamE domain-containing protein n=1 Tax=Bordetella genomosp. 4 TaxID=463044 RepID=A0A261URR4_9BORD|nr:outer membrane protein assembly factor BamE [Bordetella genomosp. 4]OZI64598.1 hypothetical protein CAL20_02780 [Bordetella genomosp. 4]
MRFWASVCALVLIAGCVSTGVQVKDEQLSSFVPGQTTRQEVIAALGQPTTQMRNADGTSMLIYTHVEAQARAASFIPIVGAFVGGADSRSNQVTLNFDSDGKLLGHSSTESAYGTGYGLSAGQVESVTDQPRKAP